MEQTGLSELVRAAGDGDQRAWEALVGRFNGLVWSVARAHGLSRADAADVCQTAWLRLVEHLHRLRDPERVGTWLASTARHEALEGAGALAESPEASALASERNDLLWRAFAELPQRCQRLLRVLMADPAPSYQQVAVALEMPIGSIGPTRGRCLDRLRQLSAL
jgi:RNA polymerase sigma factor (sigma-70 family)